MSRRSWTLLTVCAGTFMLLLDVTIVNVALPDIQRDLDTSFADLQWVIDAYVLTLAALLLTAGSLGDRLGAREVYVAGLVVFTLASLGCALSTGPVGLVVARGVQGVGAAIMFATSLALLAGAFTGKARGRAFGIYGAITGAAVAVGPLVGGALTETLGWRWIFYVNLPIGIAVIAALLLTLPRSRPTQRTRLDVAGPVLFSASLALLVLALIRGNDLGWSSPPIVGALVGSAVLLALFVLAQQRQADAMLDLSLFRVRSFVGVSVGAFALHSTIFSVFLYLTLYLQNILGYGPLEAGLRFLPLSVLAFVAAAVAGPLTETVPRRLLLGGGLTLVGVGLLLLRIGVGVDTSWTALIPGFVVAGIGVGLVNPALSSTAIDVVDPNRSGMASGINSTFRQVGIATGIAGLGALFVGQVQGGTAASLTALGVSGAGAQGVIAASSSGDTSGPIAALPGPVADAAAEAVRVAFVGGLHLVLVVAAVLALVGAAVAGLLVNPGDQQQRSSPPAGVDGSPGPRGAPAVGSPRR